MTEDYSLNKVEEGTLITVNTNEAAVIVEENERERIYLPSKSKKNNSYYSASRKSLNKKQKSLEILHKGNPDTVKVFSTQEN